MNRVFVYGTLMRGFGNHRLLSNSIFVREARTVPIFEMISLGGFPAILAGGKTSIVGEVFDVGHATLAQLDRLEGHPHFYERMLIALESGNELDTWSGGKVYAYVLSRGRMRFGRTDPVVASGSWREHVQAEEARAHEDDEPEGWFADETEATP
jgi:gamma-glutamylaminecyclotransferase